eukprot:1718695-Amphidinium_carterae.1
MRSVQSAAQQRLLRKEHLKRKSPSRTQKMEQRLTDAGDDCDNHDASHSAFQTCKRGRGRLEMEIGQYRSGFVAVQAWTGESTGSLFDWLTTIAQKNSRRMPFPMWSIASASQ